jgi:hypothetical protein
LLELQAYAIMPAVQSFLRSVWWFPLKLLSAHPLCTSNVILKALPTETFLPDSGGYSTISISKEQERNLGTDGSHL